MKYYTSNLLKISALLAIIIIITASCGRRKLPDNYFKIGEDVYEIKEGIIINNGETEGGFDLDVRLYCENKIDFINFSIISKEAERIYAKTYTESDFEASWVLGYNNGAYSNMGNITSGNIVVERHKDGYSIEIVCTDQYSNKIEGEFKGNLAKQDINNLVHVIPEYVLPNAIYDKVISYIPVYSGLTPPDMTGEYVSSPHILIYESYGTNPDSIQYYSDRYLGFVYDSKQMNFYGKQYDATQNKDIEEIQYGVKITGEDEYFTCYYIVDGYPGGYYAQQSFIFSGKKTDEGLEDFHTAVILLETSGNPDMYEKHSFRVLKDEDGLAEYNNWLTKKSVEKNNNSKNEDLFKMWMK